MPMTAPIVWIVRPGPVGGRVEATVDGERVGATVTGPVPSEGWLEACVRAHAARRREEEAQ
jgi:hypothetical protein